MKRLSYLFAFIIVVAISIYSFSSRSSAAANPLTILAPGTDHLQFDKPPVEIKVRLDGVSRLGFRATLNGRDVTSLFGPPRGGLMQAVLGAEYLKHGVNNFEAKLGNHKAWRSFKVKSLRPAALAPGQISAVPLSQPGYPGADLWIPIQTRIINGDGSNATDYAIRVGDQTFTAPPLPDGSATGYQILLLDRVKLEPISQNSNMSYPTGDASDMFSLLQFGGNLKNCGDRGCLMVVQSLQTPGFTAAECPVYGCSLPTTPGYFFSALGGSRLLDLANGRTPHTGYSLIANVGPNGAQAGTGFERLTCNQASDCGRGDLIPTGGGGGAISGALVKDNFGAYTFAYPGRATFTTGTGASPTSNTISIRGTPNSGEYKSDDIPNGFGAFHIVVIYRDSLQLVYQNTFNFDHLYSDDQSQWTMTRVLEDVRDHGNYLVLISSIGNLWHGNWTVQWSKVGEAIKRLGGTYSVFMSLASGDDYSFAGATDTRYGEGSVEASSVISRATHPPGSSLPKSKLRGMLARNNQGNYRPMLSNLTSTFDQYATLGIVDAAALEPPIAWPSVNDASGGLNAYQWISNRAGKGYDFRGNYTETKALFSDGDLDFTCSTEPGCVAALAAGSFTQSDFDRVKAQLLQELNFVVEIRQYAKNIQTLQTAIYAGENTIIEGAYTEVASSLNVDQSKLVTPKWIRVAEFGAAALGDTIAISGGPEAKLGYDVVNGVINASLSFLNTQSGSPAAKLETTLRDLQQRTVNDFTDAQIMAGNLFDLILADWGRIQSLGNPLVYGPLKWDLVDNGKALEAINHGLRTEYFFKFYSQLPYEIDHWTNVAEGSLPQDLSPICRYYNFNVPSGYCDYWQKAQSETWLALPSSPTGKTPSSGNDQQNYDIYLISKGVNRCNGLPDLFNDGGLLGKLFAPIDPNDSNNLDKLGVYKPYFFLYESGFPLKENLSHHCTFP